MALLSLKEAAAAVGKDPSTVTRAVKKGDLSAQTDPRSGNRRFDVSELIRVFGPLKSSGADATPKILNPDEMASLKARIDELQARNVELESTQATSAAEVQARIDKEVDDIRAQRDRWATEAEDWKKMAQQASENIPTLMLEHFKEGTAAAAAQAPPMRRSLLGWLRT